MFRLSLSPHASSAETNTVNSRGNKHEKCSFLILRRISAEAFFFVSFDLESFRAWKLEEIAFILMQKFA